MTFAAWVGYLSEWIGVIAVVLILGVSPRFRRRPIRFQYQRREIVLILIFFAIIFIWSGLGNSGVVPLKNSAPQYLQPDLWVRMLIAVTSMLPFIIALYIRRQPFLSVGWAKSMLTSGLQMGLALAFITFFLRNKVYSVTNGVTAEELNALLLCAGISLAEESIFRGYIQTRLVSIWGKIPGMVATAGLYLLFQLPRFWANPETLLINLLLVAVQGLLLCWIASKSGHVLAPALYRLISEWVIFLS